MAKVKINANLFERMKKAAAKTGYSSAEEFLIHIIEKELSGSETDNTDQQITDQLRGLGYIE